MTRFTRNRPRLVGVGIVVMCALLAVALVGCSSPASSGGSTGGSSTGGGNTGGSGGSGTTAGGATIVEKGFAFSPAALTVKVGDTVTFTNEDSAAHIVKIDGTELGQQDQGASVTWTPTKAGSYPYSCTIHPSMTGEITVQ